MGKSRSQSPNRGTKFHRNSVYAESCPCKVEGNFVRCSPMEECIIDKRIPNRMGNVARCDCYGSDNSLARLQSGQEKIQANATDGQSASFNDEEDLTGRAMEIINVVDDLLEQAAALKQRLIVMVSHFQAKGCKCSERHCPCGVALNDRGRCKCLYSEEPLQTTLYDTNWNADSFSNKISEHKSTKNISISRSTPQNTVYQNMSIARTRGGSIEEDRPGQDLSLNQNVVSNSINNTQLQEYGAESHASDYSTTVPGQGITTYAVAVSVNESQQQQNRMENRDDDEDERRSRGGRHQSITGRSRVSSVPSSRPSFHISNISKKLLSIQQEIETLRQDVGRLSYDTVLRTHSDEAPSMLEEIMSSNLIGKADEIKETLAEIKSDFCQKLSGSGGQLLSIGEKRVQEKVEREIRRTHPDYSRTINQVKLTKGDRIADKNLRRTVFDQTYQTNIDTQKSGESKAKNVTLTVEKRTDETIRNPLADDEYRHVLKQSNKLIKTDDRSIKEEDAFHEEEVKRDEKRVIETRRRVTRTEQLAGKDPTEEIIVNVKINRTIDEKTGQIFETMQELGNEPFTNYPEETLTRVDQLTEQPSSISPGSTTLKEGKQNDLFRNNFESKLQSGDRSKGGSIAKSALTTAKSRFVSNTTNKAASYFEVVAGENTFNEPQSKAFIYSQQEPEGALSNEYFVQSCNYETEQCRTEPNAEKLNDREEEYVQVSKFRYDDQDSRMECPRRNSQQDYQDDIQTLRCERRSSVGEKQYDHKSMEDGWLYDGSQRTDKTRRKSKQYIEESSQTECASRKSYTSLEQAEAQFFYKVGSQTHILTESDFERICADRSTKRRESIKSQRDPFPVTSKSTYKTRISAGADYLENVRANFSHKEKNQQIEKNTGNISSMPRHIESQKHTTFAKPHSQSDLACNSNTANISDRHIYHADINEARQKFCVNPQHHCTLDKSKPLIADTSPQRFAKSPEEKDIKTTLPIDKNFKLTHKSEPSTSNSTAMVRKENRLAGGVVYFRPENQHDNSLGRPLHKFPLQEDNKLRSTSKQNHRVSSTPRPEPSGQTSRAQHRKSSENGRRFGAGENTINATINSTESARLLSISQKPNSSRNSPSPATQRTSTKDRLGKSSQGIQSPATQRLARHIRKSMPHSPRQTAHSPLNAVSDTETSVRSIDVDSIPKVIEELSGGRPPTDFFVSVLPEQMQTKTLRINVIDKQTGNLLGYFYINEEKFHLARTRGVFNNYLTLYVLNSIGSITDFKNGINPKSLNRYQCFAKYACTEK